MPRWVLWPCRAVGAINLLLCAFGLYCLLHYVMFWVTHPHADPREPYFYHAFFTMGGINLIYIVVLICSALDLIGRGACAIRFYTWLVLVLVSYDVLVGILWFLPGPVGMSIAGATGVGNMGIAPFEFVLFYIPFGYPLLSAGLLNLARWRARRISLLPTIST